MDKCKDLGFQEPFQPVPRDTLSAHPRQKIILKLIAKIEDKPQTQNKLSTKPCKHQQNDRSSYDDYDEMDDRRNDKSEVKGFWAKKKTRIDDSINTKVLMNMYRTMCKQRIKYSVHKE